MPLLLVLAFIFVPLAELYVIVQAGQAIGVLPTIALLAAISIAGAWLLRREGGAAWHRFRDALATGRLPTAEVVDGALVILGGALLLTPGFLTDGVGFLLIVPPSRAVVNRALRTRARRFVGLPGRAPKPQHDPVVEVEVIDVQRDQERERG